MVALHSILNPVPKASLAQAFPSERDVRTWPFSETSIWNMPVGSDANYIPAELEIPSRFTTDEDIIILKPSAPITPIYYTDISWGDEARVYGARCERQGELLATVPIPTNYLFFPPEGETPNAGMAALMSDGRSLFQGQPFSRCYAGDYGTMTYAQSELQDIYGDGYYGAHGGSGLSAIGGTIRLGELLPNSVIRHALKINVWAARNLSYNDDATPGYRWPALRSDGYAQEVYGGTNVAMEMGALLALRPDFNESSLQTMPGQIIARALKDYGAYIVEDTYWDASALIVETGPDGDVREEFLATYGYDIRVSDNSSGEGANWYQDLSTIFENLNVINNNSEFNIGGGGTPQQPMAPPFQPSPNSSSSAVDAQSIPLRERSGNVIPEGW